MLRSFCYGSGHCPLSVWGGILYFEIGQSCDAFQAILLEETCPRCNNTWQYMYVSHHWCPAVMTCRYFICLNICVAHTILQSVDLLKQFSHINLELLRVILRWIEPLLFVCCYKLHHIIMWIYYVLQPEKAIEVLWKCVEEKPKRCFTCQ